MGSSTEDLGVFSWITSFAPMTRLTAAASALTELDTWWELWVLQACSSRLVLVLPCSRFCLINAGVLYLYFSNYLQIDEEEYGGTWELTKEGFMTSFALFMVCVTEIHSKVCHFLGLSVIQGEPFDSHIV